MPAKPRYPNAVHPRKVGSYPAKAYSGGGFFYDDVLEYRVWKGATFEVFPTYAKALAYYEETARTQEPIALVLQKEHINELKPGKYEHIVGDRVTEWRVDWLPGSSRKASTIKNFLKKHGAKKG